MLTVLTMFNRNTLSQNLIGLPIIDEVTSFFNEPFMTHNVVIWVDHCYVLLIPVFVLVKSDYLIKIDTQELKYYTCFYNNNVSICRDKGRKNEILKYITVNPRFSPTLELAPM